jgi:hypothetical protein
MFSVTGVLVIDRSCTSYAVRTLYRIGLDPARFRSYSTADAEELNVTTLDSQIPEGERYNNADPLKILCRHCETETDFVPIHDRQVCCDIPATFGLHYLLLPISNAIEIPLITLGANVPSLS